MTAHLALPQPCKASGQISPLCLASDPAENREIRFTQHTPRTQRAPTTAGRFIRCHRLLLLQPTFSQRSLFCAELPFNIPLTRLYCLVLPLKLSLIFFLLLANHKLLILSHLVCVCPHLSGIMPDEEICSRYWRPIPVYSCTWLHTGYALNLAKRF